MEEHHLPAQHVIDREPNCANRYDVRITRSVYFYGGLNESTFNGISFVVKR